jgi:hypothetical protein
VRRRDESSELSVSDLWKRFFPTTGLVAGRHLEAGRAREGSECFFLEGSRFVEAAGGCPEEDAWSCRSCSGSDVGTSVGSVFEGFTLGFLPFVEDEIGFRDCFSGAGNGTYRGNDGISQDLRSWNE